MDTLAINTTYSSDNILEVNENQLKQSSYSFPPPLTIDLDKSSSPSTSSSNSSTTSSSSTSTSPIPSSPSSSTSSVFSLSYTTNSSSSPSSKPEIKSIGGDEFYHGLQNHSSLLRIVLQKEFPLKIVDGQWYRLDLQVVNELGLSLGKERTKNAIMSLACELLELKDNNNNYSDDDNSGKKRKQRCIQDIHEKDENSYSLTWRALQFDAWEWDEEMQVPEFAGFEKCSKGGLEFKLQIKKYDFIKKHHHSHHLPSSPRFFMRIIPTFDSNQTIHALPLVVGPFSIMEEEKKAVDQYQQPIMNHHQYHQIQQQQYNSNNKIIHGSNVNNISHIQQQQKDDLWIMDLWYQEMYRAFKLNIQDRYFLVKEGWTLGTPGKMWDSALVLSDILVRRMVEHPTCFHQRHILDLSAGTGIVGLLVVFYYQHLYPKFNAKVTLTDLPEALHLIQHNQQLNDIKTNNDISIEPLRWGNYFDIKRIKSKKQPIDLIIASDVLYQPDKFKVLVGTLAALSTPGRTVIYLGYKRRGLDIHDENYFFELCRKHFHLQLIKNDDDNDNGDGNTATKEEIIDPVFWERRYGGLKRDQDYFDAYGWLGPCIDNWKKMDKNNYQQLCQQTGVQIFRLIKKRL
ncbi:unnamed protein product [Cunninghamella echinulata]